MFFFLKKSDISSRISKRLQDFIMAPFLRIEADDAEKIWDSESIFFWRDKYIIGYVHALALFELVHQFKGAQFNKNQQSEIILLVFQKICPNEWRAVLTLINESQVLRNSEFIRGSEDATTYFGQLTGTLKKDDSNPVFLAAQKGEGKVRELLNCTGLSLSEDEILLQEIVELTFMKHVYEHYIKDHLKNDARNI